MRRTWPILWAALLASGCGDETGAADPDFGRPDVSGLIDDAGPPRDTQVGPDSALGVECADPADCPSGFCVARDDGRRVCSERCGNDGDCPDDWLCRQVSNTGPDVTFICVPEASPCGGVELSDDPDNCGACGARCAYPFAEAACRDGVCELAGCLDGHHDLNGDDADGCEYACTVTRGGAEACDAIDNDCDGIVDETFDLSFDPENCGACGGRCLFDNASARCVDGECHLDRCDPGHIDEDGDPSNGCEAPTCPGRMPETCNRQDDDCDGSVDEGFDLDNDLEHCGGCGARCAAPHATVACVEGACLIEQCDPGLFDVDGAVDNGCECLARPEVCDRGDNDCDGRADEGFDLTADTQNCGACGVVCAFADATAACVDGQCVIDDCRDGFVDRDGAAANGCECRAVAEVCNATDDDCDGMADEGFDIASDVRHCGACGVECRPDNAEPACTEGRCAIERCRDGAVDLDRSPENGCEYLCRATGGERCNGIDDDCDGIVDDGFDLAGDPTNCGGCGRICDFANAEARCVEGACAQGRCDEGFFDLDGIAGCEYACVPEGPEVCDGADDDCDGRVDEGLDLDGDPENCGRCGRSCAAERAETACVEGDCRLVACDPGHVDLDGALANGCEYACVADGPEECDEEDDDCDGMIDEGFDLRGDPDNCGLCGLGCGFVNATALCVEGRCTAGPCDRGFVDLDDLPGCEYACDGAPDGLERCNGADDDCDGVVDEQELAPCPVDRSGDFLVEADPDEQIVGGFLPIQFIPAILTLEVQPPDVSGEMTGPDGQPIVYAGSIVGDSMALTASYVDPSGLQHDETWEVVWVGVDGFAGIMTDRMTLPGFGLFDVLVWNVTGTRQ